MESCEKAAGRVRQQILERIDFSRRVEDEEVLTIIDELLLAEKGLSLAERVRLRQDLFHSIRRLDVLQDLLDKDSVTEIMINGPEKIFVEEAGVIRAWDRGFSSPEKLEDVIQQIVSDCNRTVNASSPIADARLPSGDRVNVVLPPVALDGPAVTIRRFPKTPIGMEDLLAFGSLSQEMARFLRDLVRAGYNIFVSGGTGSGKTTFLNALSGYIPETDRVITIEDNAELQIRHVANLIRLEARNANVEGENAVTIRDLIRSSLRMRPDRIIVGEVRGGEALDMLQACNTGHDGSMSTGHANSATDCLARLETMTLMAGVDLPVPAIRGQIASALDILVHLGRLRDRSRRVLEIREILGLRNGAVDTALLYAFEETGEEDGRIIGKWERKQALTRTYKLEMAGLAEDP